MLNGEILRNIAIQDGFLSVVELISFFKKTHSLPFDGQIINWWYMTRIKSDTWDSGNSMTRFHEVIRICETCNGEGKLYSDEDYIRCETCDGEGAVVFYE